MNYNDVSFEASYGKTEQLPKADLPEIAFAGRSNVGKSSMINKVFNRKRLARVSSTPGKTATVNFFKVGDIRFADLPGYGYAKVSKSEKQRWAKLMEGYFGSNRGIALVFQLIDIRHSPTKDDMVMLDFLTGNEIPFAVVLTKCDKLSKRERGERMDAFKSEIPGSGDISITPFSAETGEGVEEIKAIIESTVNRLKASRLDT